MGRLSTPDLVIPTHRARNIRHTGFNCRPEGKGKRLPQKPSTAISPFISLLSPFWGGEENAGLVLRKILQGFMQYACLKRKFSLRGKIPPFHRV